MFKRKGDRSIRSRNRKLRAGSERTSKSLSRSSSKPTTRYSVSREDYKEHESTSNKTIPVRKIVAFPFLQSCLQAFEGMRKLLKYKYELRTAREIGSVFLRNRFCMCTAF